MQKVLESFREFQKVLESFRELQRVLESFREFQKVSESFTKLQRDIESFRDRDPATLGAKYLEFRDKIDALYDDIMSGLRDAYSYTKSDNGTEFTCKEFQNVLVNNCVKHEKSAPYSPH